MLFRSGWWRGARLAPVAKSRPEPGPFGNRSVKYLENDLDYVGVSQIATTWRNLLPMEEGLLRSNTSCVVKHNVGVFFLRDAIKIIKPLKNNENNRIFEAISDISGARLDKTPEYSILHGAGAM